MGMIIECGGKDYSRSYGNWNKIRMGYLKMTLEYLEKLSKQITSLECSDDINIAEQNVYKLRKIHDILDYKEIMLIDVDKFLDVVSENKLVNTFIYLDICGCYAFLNKNDCEGYYSPGNALDILRTYKKCKPRNKEFIDDFKQVIPILKESIKSDEKIIIY